MIHKIKKKVKVCMTFQVVYLFRRRSVCLPKCMWELNTYEMTDYYG